MAARESTIPCDLFELDERLADPAHALAAANEYIAGISLRDDPKVASPDRRVGLELEMHLVDLTRPALRPSWDDVQDFLATLPEFPSRSSITVEPGGQLELSTPPALGVAAAIAALHADRKVLAAALSAAGLGGAPLGTDIARAPQRVNPAPRYAAMERHFAALRCARAGKAMMTATAALQINLDAGPASQWASRVAHLRGLGPVLVALSACSPLLAGRRSGWPSMRQQTWYGIDARRGRAESSADPTEAWASYALDAPVMLLHDQGRCRPLTRRMSLRSWLDGSAPFERRPTAADLDYHLTTLFPPIRLRGYLELRCVDAVPDRWWPALAAIAVTLADDERCADRAAELCEPVRERWLLAAREGLRDPRIAAAARGCAELAVRHCPAELRADVEAYAELVAARRTPGDDIRERAAQTSPLAVLQEHARA